MASQIHFLDIKGKPLLSRDYKGDISSTTIEKFPLLLLELENTVDDGEYKPFINHEGINYIFINHNNLYICALTRKNENIMTIIIFLSKLVEVMTQYFKSLEEESIKDNFVIIYWSRAHPRTWLLRLMLWPILSVGEKKVYFTRRTKHFWMWLSRSTCWLLPMAKCWIVRFWGKSRSNRIWAVCQIWG